MSTLITGAAGFVGFHLAKYLSEKGNKLILVDNFERSKNDQAFNLLCNNPDVKFYKLDITEKKSFHKIKEDISNVYHLAAINGTKNFYDIPDKVITVNSVGTLNLLEWLKDKPKVKVLYASSSEVYAGAIKLGIGTVPTDEGVPICIDDISNVRWSYGISKALAESALFAYSSRYSLRFSIIRYHNIFGPRMGLDHVIPQFSMRIMNGDLPLKVYGCDQTRSFCYVSDAVRASKLVMESSSLDGKIVHVGNDEEEIKIADLAKMMLDMSSNPTEIIECDAPKGSVERRCPNITSLRSTGFNPNVPLKVGVKKTMAWYQTYSNI